MPMAEASSKVRYRVRSGRAPRPEQVLDPLPTAVAAVPARRFRDGRDAFAKSENRQWIERRSRSFFDAQRRSCEQKFETI
jgi:hypothetical protein